MKARITTVLSLTGVLVAGSAAALVNTQVLQSSTTKSTASAEVVLGDEPESASTVGTTPPSVSISVPNKFSGIAGVAVKLASTPVSTQQEYAIGDSGTVVLDTANGVLTIVSVNPAAGWAVVEQQNTGPLSVEVTFQSATTQVEFKANALMGVVAWDTESSLLTQPTTANTAGDTTKPTVGTSGTTQHSTETSVDDDDDDDSGHHGGGGDDD